MVFFGRRFLELPRRTQRHETRKGESREAVSASWWPLWVTRSSPAQKHGRWCRSAPRLPQVVGRDAGIFIHPSPQILVEGCPGDGHFWAAHVDHVGSSGQRQISGKQWQGWWSKAVQSGEERMVTKGSWTGHRQLLPLLAAVPGLISLLDVSWLRASNPSSY